MSLTVTLFFLSWFLIFHSYVFFPAVLHLFKTMKPSRRVNDPSKSVLPLVTIVIAERNSGAIITETILAINSSAYPRESIEILVGSDASDSFTRSKLEEIANEQSNVRYHYFSERSGKSGVLQKLLPHIRSEIVIMTDSAVILTENVLREIVDPFVDPTVGIVSAHVVLMSAEKASAEDFYTPYEFRIKILEGKIWGTAMPYGACYAVRRELLGGMTEGLIGEDSFISCACMKSGMKSIVSETALVHLGRTPSNLTEFSRRIRIGAGNMQNLFANLGVFLNPRFCFSLISHKVLRWFTPHLMLFSAFLCFGLSFDSEVFKAIGVMHIILFLTPVIALLDSTPSRLPRPIAILSYFMLMNLAIFIGSFKYFFFNELHIWTPSVRKSK